MKLTTYSYCVNSDFSAHSPKADIFCTGSDQVWNPDLLGGGLKPFYLSFLPDGKRRFAWAASFGKDEISDEQIAETLPYIHKYEAISMREKNGADILINRYQYKNAIQLVDPTLSLSGKFWLSHIKISPVIKCCYILVFTIKPLYKNKDFSNFCFQLAKRTNSRLYRICTRYHHFNYACGKPLMSPKVFDFINLIANAKLVITDSFHGTAFSLNLGTEPICIYPTGSSGRIDSLLKLVGEEKRRLRGYDDFEIKNRCVDWEKVNSVLEYERKRTDDFLNSVLDR